MVTQWKDEVGMPNVFFFSQRLRYRNIVSRILISWFSRSHNFWLQIGQFTTPQLTRRSTHKSSGAQNDMALGYLGHMLQVIDPLPCLAETTWTTHTLFSPFCWLRILHLRLLWFCLLHVLRHLFLQLFLYEKTLKETKLENKIYIAINTIKLHN